MKILPNGIAVIENDGWISKWVEQHGRLDHDRYLLDQIVPLIPEGGIAIDTGANIGSHTVAYAERAGAVYAIEANPEAYECLMHNTEEVLNVYRLKYALSDTVGVAYIRRDPNNPGASYLGETGTSSDAIPCSTLDRLFTTEKIDFIKLDIEGYEYKALLGARGILERCKPVIVCEINKGALARNNHSWTDINNLLVEEMGYKQPYTIPPNMSERDLQFDAVYLP